MGQLSDGLFEVKLRNCEYVHGSPDTQLTGLPEQPGCGE